MDVAVLIARIIVPLLIFRLPLIGGLLSMFLDGVDWHLNSINSSDWRYDYAQIDKWLDIYYLSIEMWVVLHWKDVWVKSIAVILFILRAVGVFWFEVTGMQTWLFIFPNVFENFFIFYLSVSIVLRRKTKIPHWILFFSAIALAIPKLIQEYRMHVLLLWEWRYITIRLFSRSIVFRYDNIVYQVLTMVGLILFIVWLLTRKRTKML